ncbi:chondroitin sulfate glucuronyltransferase-like [Dreissena polymorpha]|uniref:Hexosyltransferase n=1 Tax=Dreissena polymorpha TaxID=45954 RepID=A0A9D4HCH0_DREPO|nr:chondroitin sulfate glucuronyltransferase-like [Dreissena polymorpha]KAH3714992.1 hypothetical protein DPMN_057695 [Dreissena polymorpha]
MISILQKGWDLFMLVLGFPAQRAVCFRPHVLPIVIGLCLGITIHMMFAPFLEEGCTLHLQSANVKSASHGESHKALTGNDDFEARIVKTIPNITHVDASAARPKVARPRFITTELGIREKLFVAVFTSAYSIDKLGVALDKTLTNHVTKAIFFTIEKPKVIPTGLPTVAFSDSHNEMLPLHVLKYIKEHYAENYDFYLFLSDRTYLRADKYINLVEHISVRDDVYMGVPAMERKFCSLEGGVLLSQSVISQVLSRVDSCLGDVHPDNPSVTLGRCVHQTTQRNCAQKGGDQSLAYFHLEDFDYDADIDRLRDDPAFNASLTFYPMPDDIAHYKLHRYMCYVDLNETRSAIQTLERDIVQLSGQSPGGRGSLTWPLGVQPSYKPLNRFSVLQWTYFTETHLYLDNELTNIKEITGADRLDIADIKKFTMDSLSEKYYSRYELQRILNGYRRFDPTRGMEYVLDLQLTDRNHQNAETVKRVLIIRPLGKVELVPMPYVTENMMVNVILPLLPDEVGLFGVFIDSYARSCLQNKEDVRLIIALLYPNLAAGETRTKDLFGRPKALVSDFSKKFDTQGKLTWKALENVVSDIDVMDSLLPEFKTDSLILMTTVNMEMSTEITNSYFNRVRMNTIKGMQVFFPMGFWQHKPNLIYNKKPLPSSVEVGQKLGVFSPRSTQHASFYMSDYQTVRKLLLPSGSKSGDIFNMFLNYKNIHVFRAVEPNLKLKWMNLTCDPRVTTQKYQQCITRNLEGLASQHHLALLIFNQTDISKSRLMAVQGSKSLDRGRAESLQGDLPGGLSLPLQSLNQANMDPEPADPVAEDMLLVDIKKRS